MNIQPITAEAAVSALGLLALRYSPKPMPWTDPNADQDVRTGTMRTWVEAMRKYDEAAVLAAFERACVEHPEWPPNLNVMHSMMQAEARSLAVRRAGEQRRELAIRCDGSAWLEVPNPDNPDALPSMRPCPACNPFLHTLYLDGVLHNCTGHRLEERRTAWLNEHGGMPARCLPATHDDEGSDPERARAAMRQLAEQLRARDTSSSRGRR